MNKRTNAVAGGTPAHRHTGTLIIYALSALRTLVVKTAFNCNALINNSQNKET